MSKPKKRAAPPRPVSLELGRIVYIVTLALSQDLPKRRLQALRKANPWAREGAPAVYVGETGLSASKRVYNHVTGHQSSWWVRVLGEKLVRLDDGVPSLGHDLPEEVLRRMAKLGQRSTEDSKIREKAVAERLREQGWWVVCA